MNVLSLFNGISVGRMALDSLGVEVGNYYSSEIDKFAIKASNTLYPDTVQLGSVLDWKEWDIDWSSIDLVTGGFPCQAWSTAGKQMGDKDPRGMLFWTMLEIVSMVKLHNPSAHFIIENVKMKSDFEKYITFHTEQALGVVHKILINSALVSAQNRQRYYWTSFEVSQPEDLGIMFCDILEDDPKNPTIMSDKFCTRNKRILRDDFSGKAKCLSALEYVKNGRQGDYIRCGRIVGRRVNPDTGKRDDYNYDIKAVQRFEPRPDNKSGTLTTVQKDNVLGIDGKYYRKLTPRECMRLQTVPEDHIDALLNSGISNTQLYKMTGNAWTMEVIKHLFKDMLK